MSKESRKIVKGRVSVVTPVYNGEQFLKRFLDSLLSQTYMDMEVILVDDGSSDHTLDIAKSYTDAFCHKGYPFKIIQAKHKNASAAINQGLPYVTGEYLIWPDSDDVLKHLTYNCVRSIAYYFEDKTGKLTRPDEQKGSFIKEELFWDVLESKTFVCCGCYMLKTEIFFQIYPQKKIPEYDVGQNFQMLLPYLYFNKCYTIPEELYGVSVRSGSHSRTPLTKKQETIKFQNYEKLVDEISNICHLNIEERKRIYLWKLERRYWLAKKYDDKKLALSCIYHLFQEKKIGFVQLVKRAIWLYVDNKWLKNILYRCNLYQHILNDKIHFLIKTNKTG